MTRLTQDAATAPRKYAITRRRLAVFLTAFLLVFAAVAMTGCGMSADDCKGDPGTVTDKDRDSHSSYTGVGAHRHRTTTYDYDITIRRADGSTYEKDLSGSHAYDAYVRGGHFPAKECKKD